MGVRQSLPTGLGALTSWGCWRRGLQAGLARILSEACGALPPGDLLPLPVGQVRNHLPRSRALGCAETWASELAAVTLPHCLATSANQALDTRAESSCCLLHHRPTTFPSWRMDARARPPCWPAKMARGTRNASRCHFHPPDLARVHPSHPEL